MPDKFHDVTQPHHLVVQQDQRDRLDEVEPVEVEYSDDA